jgi:hypothetical protein
MQSTLRGIPASGLAGLTFWLAVGLFTGTSAQVPDAEKAKTGAGQYGEENSTAEESAGAQQDGAQTSAEETDDAQTDAETDGAQTDKTEKSGAAAQEERDRVCPVCPAPRTAPCCPLDLGLGPRLGISVNGDQWIAGAHLRWGFPCLGRLGMMPVVYMGLGGNHLTARASLRLDYLVRIGGEQGFSIYPAVGGSVIFYMPVGHFASFCHRVDLNECWGYDFGLELGGGLGYHWFALDVIAGFAGIPVVTITATATFPLFGSNETE